VFPPLAVVGTARLAKPTSVWARHFYSGGTGLCVAEVSGACLREQLIDLGRRGAADEEHV
jgi:hypothetical protein